MQSNKEIYPSNQVLGDIEMSRNVVYGVTGKPHDHEYDYPTIIATNKGSV